MIQFLLFALCLQRGLARRIDVYKSWKTVDYNFPADWSRDEWIASQKFIPRNVVTLDVDAYKFDTCHQKMFVTTPRLQPGTPATLSTLSSNGLLSPYPSWDWQSDSDCDKLISVLRIAIDDCGRLWALDDGKLNAFDDVPTYVCPPKVTIFNLANDQLIGRYSVPSELHAKENSLFANIAVDSKHCDKSFAFLSDVTHHKLVVFNLETREFWRWNHTALDSVSPFTNFTVNGVNFTLNDGVLALAYYPKNDRLYFNSFASLDQHSVPGRFLRNDDNSHGGNAVTTYAGTRVSQATTHAISDDGVLFYNPVSENSIRCWNVATSYTKSNQPIVAKDDERLQFLTGMKVRDGRYWGVSTRLQKFIEGSTSTNDTNYRIVTQTVKELTRGTKCETNRNAPPFFFRVRVFGF